jgi:hypothetical protein
MASMVLALLALRCGPMAPVLCEVPECIAAADGVGLTSDLEQLQQPSCITTTFSGNNVASPACWTAVCPACLSEQLDGHGSNHQVRNGICLVICRCSGWLSADAVAAYQ